MTTLTQASSTATKEEQRQRDMRIRLEQAEARRAADEALRSAGRIWRSNSRQAKA
jgi:hypothetical protein